MTKYEICSINLAEAPSNQNIGFIQAQWWDEKSTLVVVLCHHHGDLTRLRMDLDKRSFLDHLKDPRDDSDLQSFAAQIWEIIAKKRFARERSHQ